MLELQISHPIADFRFDLPWGTSGDYDFASWVVGTTSLHQMFSSGGVIQQDVLLVFISEICFSELESVDDDLVM